MLQFIASKEYLDFIFSAFFFIFAAQATECRNKSQSVRTKAYAETDCKQEKAVRTALEYFRWAYHLRKHEMPKDELSYIVDLLEMSGRI